MTEKMTPDFLYEVNFLSSLESSPDKKKAFFLKSHARKEENDYISELYLLRDGDITVFGAPRKYGNLLWEDNDHLLFTEDRTEQDKKRTEVCRQTYYRLPIAGGEAREAFVLPLPAATIIPLETAEGFLVQTFLNNETIALVDLDDEARAKKLKEKEAEKDWDVVETIPFWRNGGSMTAGAYGALWRYTPEDGLKRLTGEDITAGGMQWDKVKRKVIFTASAVKAKAAMRSELYEMEITEKFADQTTDLTPLSDAEAPDAAAGWYRGDDLYMIGTDHAAHGLNQNQRMYRKTAEGTWKDVLGEELSMWNSVGSDMRLYGSPGTERDDDGNLTMISTAVADGVLKYYDGDMKELVHIRGSIDGFARVDGELYVIAMNGQDLQELYRVESPDKLAPVSAFNRELKEKYTFREPIHMTIPREHMPYKQIDGWVILPDNFDESKPYPAILDVHGGPKTVYGQVFYHEMQMWADMGYVVMFCNPKGSDGRGDDFADIRGEYGENDYADIMALVDFVTEKYPNIDQKRLGVTGGSYGGFMTNWITSHTDRFAAAATQRSISNWLSFYGVSDIGFYFATDQNGVEFDDDNVFEVLWDHSPLKYVKQVKTPTLVIHAHEDYRCPLEQGLQWYTALTDMGVDTRMVLFKGENHELSRSGKPKSRVKRLSEITAWMDKYLKG